MSPTPATSTWAPLAIKAFRALWIGGLVSNIGSALHGVAAGWLITDLSASPSTVSMLAAATALPGFLLAFRRARWPMCSIGESCCSSHRS